MPAIDQSANKSRRRWILISAGVLLVLVAAIVVWVLVAAHNADKQDQARFDRTMKLSTSEVGFSKYDEAIKLLADYEPHARTQQRQYQIEVKLGDVYYAQINYPPALQWYRKAESNGGAKDLAVIIRIARVTDAQGDKATAISYYKKALQRGGLDDLSTQEVKARITALGGTV